MRLYRSGGGGGGGGAAVAAVSFIGGRGGGSNCSSSPFRKDGRSVDVDDVNYIRVFISPMRCLLYVITSLVAAAAAVVVGCCCCFSVVAITRFGLARFPAAPVDWLAAPLRSRRRRRWPRRALSFSRREKPINLIFRSFRAILRVGVVSVGGVVFLAASSSSSSHYGLVYCLAPWRERE